MKKILFLILFLLPFREVRGQILFTGPVNSQDNAGSGDSHVAVTLTSVPAGALIVCAWGENASGGNTFSNVSDPTNGTYSNYTPGSHTIPSVNQIVGISYKENAAAGTYVITASFTQSATFGAMACKAYPGAATTGSLDVSATPRDATSTNPACNSMTTTANGDLIVSAISTLNLTPTAGSGYTIRASMTFTFYYFEDRAQTTAGAITPNWTNASSDTYGCIAAAFKAATVASGPGSKRGGGAVWGGPNKAQKKFQPRVDPYTGGDMPPIWKRQREEWEIQ